MRKALWIRIKNAWRAIRGLPPVDEPPKTNLAGGPDPGGGPG